MDDQVSRDIKAMRREYIAEMLDMARIQAELGVTFAQIGDDIGLVYAVRKHAAYLRQAITTLKELRPASNDAAPEREVA